MEKPSCKTYFTVDFEFDVAEYRKLTCKGEKEISPEKIGLRHKDEVERELRAITDRAVWRRYQYEIGLNDRYDVDVNVMIRETLQELFGKEEELRRLHERYGVTYRLVIVPYLVANYDKPSQYLSLERDIVEFLYLSGAEIDLDYYII